MKNCSVCYYWQPKDVDGVGAKDLRALCIKHEMETARDDTCPFATILKPTVAVKKTVTQAPVKTRTKRRGAEPMYIPADNRPVLKLFKHQMEAFNRYKDAEIIPLFFEMGCGKTLTLLQIAEAKYKQGAIKGMLIVAPNDVHYQWWYDLVYGIDIDGVNYREIGVPFIAQCVGGRNGQKDIYPFEKDDVFKFVSVNVDMFSQPSKWKSVVEWANSDNYLIGIDEATVIKNISSKRSQRLLYEFNNVMKRGKSVVSSAKKFPYRAVLTGTPSTNGPVDLWAIMEFCQPNFFNRNYYSFKTYYGMYTRLRVTTSYDSTREIDVPLTADTWRDIKECASYEDAYNTFGCTADTYLTVKNQVRFAGPYKHADELKQKLDTVATFKKLVDCVDMPAINHIIREVGMSDVQTRVYEDMRDDLLAQYGDYNTTASNKLVANLRLQQISSGFIMGKKTLDALLDSGDEYIAARNSDGDGEIEHDLLPNEVVWLSESCPKLDALMRDIDECDKPLIIATQYTAEAAKIYELCAKKYRTGLFTGWKVIGGIEEFKAGNLDILVANTSKIARGFNLQNSHTILIYSNSFSMETRTQLEFRVFRMGQEHRCMFIDYIASGADRASIESIKIKKNLLDYLRDKKLQEVI